MKIRSIKKIIFCILIFVSTLINAQDKKFKLGANIGLPTGYVSSFTTLSLGVEANYLFSLSNKFQLGPSVGGITYFSENIEILGVSADIGNISYLTIALAGRYIVSNMFVVGLDFGLANGISKNTSGGGYYRPLIGYNISETIMIQAAFSGIHKGGDGYSSDSITLGAVFSL